MDTNTSTIKVSKDFIKPYAGRSSGDISEWLEKVKLVAELQGVTDIAKFIPLYLEGGALSIFFQLSLADRKNLNKIEDKLLTSFADSPVVAFRKIMFTKWAGEDVDVYAIELRRLATLAGCKPATQADHIAKMAFINGMPGDVRLQLEQLEQAESPTFEAVVDRARILCAGTEKGVGISSVAAQLVPRDQPSRPDRVAQGRARNRPPGRQQPSGGMVGRGLRGGCFRCGGPHMVRFCTEVKGIMCFRCNGEGHMAAECNVDQGNGSRGTVASAATPSMD